MYTVSDLYHKLVVKLTTNIKSKSNIKLNSYVNDTLMNVYNPSIDGDILTFEVPNKDYQIGDNVKFQIALTGTNNLSDLNEGITILLDGKEYDTINSSEFPLTFNDTSTHTLQAIYKGNDEVGSAFSNILHITPKQLDPEEDSKTGVEGAYKLKLSCPSSMTYLNCPTFIYTLTKGGVAEPNRVIEKILPTDIRSNKTNSKGQSITHDVEESILRKWTVGKYKIGGKLYDHYDPQASAYQGLVCSVFKDFEVKKATPTLKIIKKPSKKKDIMTIKLLDPLGKPITNNKITYTLNGKSKSKKTNSKGNISIAFNNKGTYKYQITSASMTNYKKNTIKGSVTIK